MNEKVKLIAFHLPQYHTFPENDQWWGKGFTEWTNTRKAVPLYKGHYQPRTPLNKNYYQLDRLDDILWQMDLAKKYNVYGFCYYHYWFNGKLLLNKPLELLRDYNGDKLPYFFCWANEPWTRAWEGNTKKVLMPQEYGNQPEWEEHFQYLLTFFRDSAYMKKENMPLLVLYRTNNIPNCDEMIAYWDKRCRECGYKGIYVIEEINSFQEKAECQHSKAFLEFEPLYTMTLGRNLWDKVSFKLHSTLFNLATGNNNQCYSYDHLWKKIINRKHQEIEGKNCFLGGFVDWDNTARKGKNGRIVMGTSPEKFEKYLMLQKDKAIENNSEFIFMNAWNEWGEGTYLEPDEKYGYAYLEAVRKVFGGGCNRLILVHTYSIPNTEMRCAA